MNVGWAAIYEKGRASRVHLLDVSTIHATPIDRSKNYSRVIHPLRIRDISRVYFPPLLDMEVKTPLNQRLG